MNRQQEQQQRLLPPPPPPLLNELHEQIAALQREVEARDDSLFELQLTLASVQAETQHQLEQQAVSSTDTVRSLQEQLRRAQQEANLARSSAARQQQQQEQQQNKQCSVISPTERLGRLADGPQSTVPASVLVQAPLFVPPKHHQRQNQQSLIGESQSCSGQRLAQHLLRSTATFSLSKKDAEDHNVTSDNGSYSQLLLTLSHVASSPSSSSPRATTTTTTAVSEIDVIWWLLLEFLSSATTNPDTLPPRVDAPSKTPPIVEEEKDGTNHNVGSNRTAPTLESRHLLLLTWLRDALAYSPESCQFLIKAVLPPSESRTTTTLDTNNNVAASDLNTLQQVMRSSSSKPRRSSCIRIVTGGGGDDDDEQRVAAANGLLQRTVRELDNPLWVPTTAVVANDSHDATPLLPPSPPLAAAVVPEPSPLQCQHARRFLQRFGYPYILGSSVSLAVAFMQVLAILLSHNDKEATNSLYPDDFLDTILRVWMSAATRLVKRKHRPPTNDRRTSTTTAELAIPLRFLQWENLQNDTPVDATEAWKQLKETKSGAMIKKLSSQQLLIWMAESLHLTRMVWNLSTSAMRQSWSTTGRVASLLASVLDLMELFILPNDDLHSHPVTTECVSWLQELASQRRQETVDDRRTTKANQILLRTQQATSRSTAELWHYAPTAIAVAVQLFHRVVIRQLMDDHLPSTPVALAAVELTRVRDQLVRFLHGILQAVQEDRRHWEMVRESKTSGCRKQALSYMAVLSECLDLYTSAAAALLSIPSDGINYCKAHPDILAMLKMQMDELVEDQEEKQVMDTGD